MCEGPYHIIEKEMHMTDPTILVTGGAGFIGGNLVQHILGH